MVTKFRGYRKLLPLMGDVAGSCIPFSTYENLKAIEESRGKKRSLNAAFLQPEPRVGCVWNCGRGRWVNGVYSSVATKIAVSLDIASVLSSPPCFTGHRVSLQP